MHKSMGIITERRKPSGVAKPEGLRPAAIFRFAKIFMNRCSTSTLPELVSDRR